MENLQKKITLEELEKHYEDIYSALIYAIDSVKRRIAELVKEDMILTRQWESMEDAYDYLKKMSNDVEEFGDCVVRSYREYNEYKGELRLEQEKKQRAL